MSVLQYIKEGLSNTITLSDVYEGDLPAENERIWDYGSKIFDQKFDIIQIDPRELLSYDGKPILDSYKNATASQRKIVDYYMKHKDLYRLEIVVLDGDRIIDGNHRVVAAIKIGLPKINAVDISKPAKINTPSKGSNVEFMEASAKQKFTIPAKIAANFKIVGELNNYKNWKAKVLLANSAGEGVKKGDWESPRYVMISLDSNNIIPIAISDEHQTGYDLLYEYYYHKKLIKEEDYVSIDGNGTTYLYGRPGDTDNLKHDAKKIEAFKKWLSYGGENQPVKSGSGRGYLGDMEDVIERGGNIEVIKGKLAKSGQKLVDTLEKLAKEYNRFLSIETKMREPKESDVANFAADALNFVKDIRNFSMGPYEGLMSYGTEKKFLTLDKVENMIRKLERLQTENNYRAVADQLFTFSGVKNLIHNRLRMMKDKEKIDDYGDDGKYLAIFGDIDLAFREFNRLGDI